MEPVMGEMEEAVRKVREEVYSKIKWLLQSIPFHFHFKDGKHILVILHASTEKAKAVFTIERDDPWEVLSALELLLTNIQPQRKPQPA